MKVGDFISNKMASITMAHGRFSLKNWGRDLWSVSKSYRVALSIPQNASKSPFKKILNSMTAEGLYHSETQQKLQLTTSQYTCTVQMWSFFHTQTHTHTHLLKISRATRPPSLVPLFLTNDKLQVQWFLFVTTSYFANIQTYSVWFTALSEKIKNTLT